MEHLTFVAGKRHYFIVADSIGIHDVTPLLRILEDTQLSYELVELQDDMMNGPESLFQRLTNLKMGTYLYFAGTWMNLERVKELAERAGFSHEESQFAGIGERKIRIFCCRCHGVNDSDTNQKSIHCNHCGLQLMVTDHYSRHHRCYLGFVANV